MISAKTLKDSIIALLNAAPISALPRAENLNLIPTQKSVGDKSISAVKNCDLYHLLGDICAPAMREILKNIEDENTFKRELLNVLGINRREYLSASDDAQINDDLLGRALQKRLDEFDNKKWELDDIKYPWSNKLSQQKFHRVFMSLSISSTLQAP